MSYFYILQSLKDNKFYYGSTTNLDKRLVMHNNGRVKSTKSRKPFRIVYSKYFLAINEARYFEKNIKDSASKRNKLLKSIN